MRLVSRKMTDNHWMAMFKDMNFELGIMELYAIESDALANLPRNSDCSKLPSLTSRI